MVDAVDSFLNNAVNLYLQAVDYCRISTSQIPTPVGAEIRQIKPDSGYLARSRPELQRSGHLVGEAESSARTTGPLVSSRIRLFLPNLRPAGRKLARTAGFRSTGRDPAVLCQIPAKFAGIRRKWPDSCNFCRNLYMKNIYIFLYYFLLIFFIL